MKLNGQKLRFSVQAFFFVLTLWIGVEFVLFVRYLTSDGTAFFVPRPPGVESFLPISALMSVYYWLLTGVISDIHPAGFFILIAILAVSILFKKSFCSWICPIGFISEALADIGKKIFGKNFKITKWIDIPFRGLKYLLLGFFVYAILDMSKEALDYFIRSPYNQVADVKMLYFFTEMSSFTFLVLSFLLIGSIFIRGFWCRYLCPYGALLGMVSFISPFKVRRNKESCTDCGACSKICPSRIPVHKKSVVHSDECTSCYMCVEVCPVKKTLEYSSAKNKFVLNPRKFAIILAVIYFSIVGYAMISNNWKNSISVEEYIERFKEMKSSKYTHPGGFSEGPSTTLGASRKPYESLLSKKYENKGLSAALL